MRRLINSLVLAGLLIGWGAGCDLLDPTNVENPNVLEEEFLNFPDPTAAWLRGLERQMAIVLGGDSPNNVSGLVTPAEIASDNYDNTQTYFNQFMDALNFDFTDSDINEALQEISQLREEAQFGLNRIVPADESETPSQVAELHYFLGMSYLLTGEYFHLAPADSAGPPVPSEQQFQLALQEFNQAIELTTDDSRAVGYRIALARTYRLLGDRANAAAAAREVIQSQPDYIRFVGFDNTNGPFNEVQDALYDRGTFDDLQPLPRLDFLDPKYFSSARPRTGDDDDADIAYLKGEEAFLILAEAQLAEGDLAGAKQTLRDLLEVVANRPRTELVDVTEGRTERNPGSRPNDPEWEVAFSPADTFHTGLVAPRQEAFDVPVVSGTHVTDAILDRVDGLENLVEMLYLLRQEIFIAEGRRMVDLGLKWPVSEREVINNPNINEGDPATTGIVPDFLPPGSEIDAFTVDADAKQVTILHNLNRVIAQNRSSDRIAPFF